MLCRTNLASSSVARRDGASVRFSPPHSSVLSQTVRCKRMQLCAAEESNRVTDTRWDLGTGQIDSRNHRIWYLAAFCHTFEGTASDLWGTLISPSPYPQGFSQTLGRSMMISTNGWGKIRFPSSACLHFNIAAKISIPPVAWGIALCWVSLPNFLGHFNQTICRLRTRLVQRESQG